MQIIKPMGLVDDVPEIEVQDVEAVAGLSHRRKGVEAEETRDRIVSRESEDSEPEERHKQAVVHEWKRYIVAKVKDSEDTGDAEQSEKKTLAGGARDHGVEVGEGDAKEERRNVRRRRELESADPEAVSITVDVGDSVWAQP